MEDKNLIRSERKRQHVSHYLNGDFDGYTGFSEVKLIHNPLPEASIDQVCFETDFLGKKASFPIMINAMTGGYDEAYTINRGLAGVAGKLGLPMALGSMAIALSDAHYADSFKVVREVNPSGIILANVNAFVSPSEAARAVELVRADGLQIHLNPAQELAMREGDRDFSGRLNRIVEIAQAVTCPVIIKEVGFGIDGRAAKRLSDVGINLVDIGGAGGTNFVKIEGARNPDFIDGGLSDWGNPTAYCLLSVKKLAPKISLIASGGLRTSSDLAKALIMGADMTAIAGPLLRSLVEEGEAGLENHLKALIQGAKTLLLLAGATTLQQAHGLPFHVIGTLRDMIGEVNESVLQG